MHLTVRSRMFCLHLYFKIIIIIIIIINININVYRILNFPVVLCGCETWSLIFKKEDELEDVW